MIRLSCQVSGDGLTRFHCAEWVGWGGPLVISLLPTDVNECLTLGLCEDSECVNTRGSYLCTCRPGLLLDPSRSRCVCECREGPGWGFWGTRWDPWGPQARLRAKMPPDPRLPLHLGLGPNKPPLLRPTGMETVTASLLASGISLKALQFGIFYLLCFSLIIAVPSVASSALGRCALL